MSNHLWLIDPFDPLIVADGRPFNPDPGARATSLPFPPPSVTTGGFRTRLGFDQGGDFKTLLPTLLHTAVRGPLLVRLAADESVVAAWYVPAPADAVVREHEEIITRYALQPLDPTRFPPAQTDLPELLWATSLHLVAADRDIKGKTPPVLPRFWSWSLFAQWLLKPETSRFDLDSLQTSSDLVTIQRDVRTHVQIDRATQRANEGMLFQTQGLSFYGTSAEPAARFALAVWSASTLAPTIAPLGGERRLVEWRGSASALPPCDEAVVNAIVASKACRIVLLTPAHWQNGCVPATLPTHDLTSVELVAVANQRPETVSGWDFAYQNPQTKLFGAPKPSRRLAPAGTVLFVRLGGNETAIKAWIAAMWLQPLNDDEQASRDGFGLAVVGTWDGTLLKEIHDA